MRIFTLVGEFLDLALDILIPRFTSKEVLVQITKDGPVVVGVLEDAIFEDVKYDEVMLLKYFNLFGFVLNPVLYRIGKIEED